LVGTLRNYLRENCVME
jgi:amyloid beta precursor protein binding protein 1